jgi:ABC-type bacteriocin/lantibiotic exporter with double-glycine peptidase domain
MDALIVLLGLVIGTVIFLAFMSCVTAIVYNIRSIAITFVFCWGIGIVLAWVAWKLALVIGIIALVIFAVVKISKLFTKSDNKNQDNVEETENDDTVEETVNVSEGE